MSEWASRAAGYDVDPTGARGDQGADLLASKYRRTIAIQAKRYRKPVDDKPVQEVFASLRYHKADVGWVVTTTGFTDGARDCAHVNGVVLVELQHLGPHLVAITMHGGLADVAKLGR